jgi:Tfp pilus assembly protein PilZ
MRNGRAMKRSADEKRGRTRIALHMPVDLKRLDFFSNDANTLEPVDAIAEDMSPEGLFIATQDSFDEGSEIEIILNFAATDTDGVKTHNASVTIHGEVMWNGFKVVEEKRRRVRGIGVRFKGMDSETLEQIFALYERLHSRLI